MDEIIKKLSALLRGMWKYRRLGVAVSWLVGIVGAVVVLLMPDRYEASARVFVDTQSILRPLMSGLAVQPNVDQQVAMLSRTLISRPTVEKLIRMADLDIGDKSSARQDELITETTKAIRIRTTGRTNLYTLAYVDENPAKSQKVVESLLTLFVESSLGATRNDSDSARRFIEAQIKTYEAKLTEAETRLKEFRLHNIDMQAEGGMDMAGRMSEISSHLNQAKLDLREAESAREANRRQLEQARASVRSASGDLSASFATPELDARIDAQRRSLDTLLQRFTDQHPDVLNARRLIRDLEEQKKKQLEDMRRSALADPGSASPFENSPAIQELKRAYASSEVQVASLRARVGEYESRAAVAREKLKVAPQIEAELAQLNRDYNIHRKNYDDLVSRRESAVLSGELESTSSVADFRVIDPPRVAPKPVAPNRVLLMPVALLAALAAGLGVAFLVSQIRPVFFDAVTLRTVTELPLLGVVSLSTSEAFKQKETRSLRRFIAAVSVLVVLYLIGVVVLAYRSGFLG